jgi:hypothetical protein
MRIEFLSYHNRTKNDKVREVVKNAKDMKIRETRNHPESRERTVRRSASRIYRKILVSADHLVFGMLLLIPTDNSSMPFNSRITSQNVDRAMSHLHKSELTYHKMA